MSKLIIICILLIISIQINYTDSLNTLNAVSNLANGKIHCRLIRNICCKVDNIGDRVNGLVERKTGLAINENIIAIPQICAECSHACND